MHISGKVKQYIMGAAKFGWNVGTGKKPLLAFDWGTLVSNIKYFVESLNAQYSDALS